MKIKHCPVIGLPLLLGIFFGAGVIFHLVPVTRGLVMKLTDVFLLLANGAVFYQVWKASPSSRLIALSLLVFVLTFWVEFAGVHTGHIFGNYHYGDTMFLQLGEVPVVIAFNWLMLILATNSLASFVVKSKWPVPFLAGGLIVIFDYVMEPVAMKLDYWQWEGGFIPLQNYVAWFVIALVFSFALLWVKIRPKSALLNTYLGIQFVFFLVLNLFLP
jgi:putative membrane protein